jgi:hypothetical protein
VRARGILGLGLLASLGAFFLPAVKATAPPPRVKTVAWVNSAGEPIKRGNHRERTNPGRDPNKRHRRV